MLTLVCLGILDVAHPCLPHEQLSEIGWQEVKQNTLQQLEFWVLTHIVQAISLYHAWKKCRYEIVFAALNCRAAPMQAVSTYLVVPVWLESSWNPLCPPELKSRM